MALEDRLIYYSDFYDLGGIILKRWELFKPILHNKKRFDVFFSEVERFRNTIAHGRHLTSSQESLLQGIVTDLKNQITIHHNRNEMKEDYFIQIIRVSDNFGHIWEEYVTYPKAIFRVDDEIEFFIEANDPKRRTIHYTVYASNKLNLELESNRFILKLDNTFVGQLFLFDIIAFTPESEYKNESNISAGITVLPKL